MQRDAIVDIPEAGNVEETVESLRTQMAAMQAAIEGQSSSSFFRPKSFSGFSYEDITDFIERFERYSKFYNWTNAKKLSALMLLFEGPALAWLHTVPDETRNNYASLITALRQRFASPNEEFLQRQQLNDRKQGKSESLNSYTEDIIRRCSRLGLNDTNRMNCFISGLNDELKSHVILNRPTTFEEAESLARLKDTVSRSTKCGKAELPAPNNVINQIHDLLNEKKASEKQVETISNDNLRERQRLAELEGQVQLLMSTIDRPRASTVAPISTNYPPVQTPSTQDIDAMKRDIIAAVRDEIRKDTPQNAPTDRQDFSVGNRYPRRDSRGRNLRTTDGQPICNTCQRVGHVARYCKEAGERLLNRYHLAGAASLVCPDIQGNIPFRLLNPTDEPVTIFRGATLGQFTQKDFETTPLTDPPTPMSCTGLPTTTQRSTSLPIINPLASTIHQSDFADLQDPPRTPTPQSPTSASATPSDFPNLTNSVLSNPEKQALSELLIEYSDVLSHSTKSLGRTNLVQHRIDVGPSPPIRQPPYRAPTPNDERLKTMFKKCCMQT
ncbi:uncharacterized protein LOC114541496 [Dendronephthya gigantea]|uniref:uncharacterized protein LOC114541496 n=1 Tax=Dendronephthya gigantea TaxID=151771 RepID=UPI00106BC8A2|nr:uncharacterized protein LOC114541496 [Dendronephthya gigantea]